MSQSVAERPAAVEESPAQQAQRLERVFRLQSERQYHVARSTVKERRQKLKRILDWIYAHRDDIHAALQSDFRKPSTETDLSEILVVTSEIKHARRHLADWMRPRPADASLAFLTTSASVQFEARGMVLIIAPWNFPFNLTMGPLVSAIAAGNCVILKPSEFSPATSGLIQRMVEELFEENEIAVFQGARETSEMLLDRPFHHIFFTGSPAVGRIVQEKAAKHLATVTLELGGKSPAIVDKHVNMDDAVKKLVWGKFMNNGQTCVAPDYVLCHADRYQEFLEKMSAQVKKFYGDTPEEQKDSEHYARIISTKHHRRLADMLQESLKAGARLVFGGAVDDSQRYLAPTLLADVPMDAPVMREEIFGPILPVLPVPSVHAAVEVIRQKEKPLALYIFSSKEKNVRFLLSETSSGGACVNEAVIHFLHPNLPFGGVNFSGSGNSHGYYGFRAFSHEKSVLRHHRFAPLKLLFPPYTPLVRKLASIMVRWL
ncbi:MAG: aldehyde dehydrogenase family protein [Leptospirales bacterium]|nr:aldehyde dehydrogenase family protein [Leptospirales bacterium]